MNMKPFRNYCFLAIFLITVLNIHAQDAREILSESINKISSIGDIAYHIDVQSTNPLNGDTNRDMADCYIRRVSSDTISNMYYYFSRKDSGFNKYNGIAYYEYSPEYYNYIVKYTVKDHPEKFRILTLFNGFAPAPAKGGTLVDMSVPEFCKKLREMIGYLYQDSSQISKSVKPSDTLVDNKVCYCFSARIEQSLSYYCTIMILLDKASLLPVVYISDIKGGSAMINGSRVSLNQYTEIRYSEIRQGIGPSEYLLSERSLPEGVEILDHYREIKRLNKGDIAPVWKHQEIYTNKFLSLDSLKGKIVVLDFTSTWCLHCVEGSIDIKELALKFKGQKDVIFINIFSSSIDNREKVLKYLKLRNIEGITIYNAASSAKDYGISGYPGFFVLDRTGRITDVAYGYSSMLKDLLTKAIERSL
jgi:thiol-disulfide isomerase/thioredoxin